MATTEIRPGYSQEAFEVSRASRTACTGRPRAAHTAVPWAICVADAELERHAAAPAGARPLPFHGYYFKIVTAQGAAATGGAKDYLVKGKMSGGFALVAWPADYDVTGVMSFIVNQDGVVHENDLGPDSTKVAEAMTSYDPDPSWKVVAP